MKKTITALLVALLVLTMALPAMAEGDMLSRVLEKGKLIVATEGTWAPWTFHDENDKLVGFDIEIATLVAEKLGVEVEFVECEWDSIFAGIDSGRYDTSFNGIEYTEERAQKYDFSTPYAYIRTALIVKGDNEEIKSFEDLEGKTTANTLASTYSLLAESYGAIPTGVDDLDQTIQLVLAGRVDATLNADVSYADYMSVHPDANLKVVALTEEASNVVMPVPKTGDNESFINKINEIIEELRADGSLTAVSEKYFGMDLCTAE